MGYSIITINREFESGGSEIAQSVATRLCLPYYDKFLISSASQGAGIWASRIEALDEQLESRFSFSRQEAAYYFTADQEPMPTGDEVAKKQFEMILEISERGPCVIVGRCANHVLLNRNDVLDIFIHAGIEYRIKRAENMLGISEKQAKRIIRRTDKARRDYYKKFTGREWSDPDLYHACLNPDRLGIDACVAAICDMYER